MRRIGIAGILLLLSAMVGWAQGAPESYQGRAVAAGDVLVKVRNPQALPAIFQQKAYGQLPFLVFQLVPM